MDKLWFYCFWNIGLVNLLYLLFIVGTRLFSRFSVPRKPSPSFQVFKRLSQIKIVQFTLNSVILMLGGFNLLLDSLSLLHDFVQLPQTWQAGLILTAQGMIVVDIVAVLGTASSLLWVFEVRKKIPAGFLKNSLDPGSICRDSDNSCVVFCKPCDRPGPSQNNPVFKKE